MTMMMTIINVQEEIINDGQNVATDIRAAIVHIIFGMVTGIGMMMIGKIIGILRPIGI
jgi:hypothetical protein